MALHKSNVLASGQVALNSSTATLLVAGKDSRIGLELINNDASIVIWVGYTSAVTSSTGYPLRAAGGKLLLDGYVGPIYAISASATPTGIYVEW